MSVAKPRTENPTGLKKKNELVWRESLKGPHRLTTNSRATSVTRLRLHRSPVVGWFVLWRGNYYPAIFDFFKKRTQPQIIGAETTEAPQEKTLKRNTCSSWRGFFS